MLFVYGCSRCDYDEYDDDEDDGVFLVLNGVVATNILAFCTFDIIFKIILKKTFFSRSHKRAAQRTLGDAKNSSARRLFG